MCKHSVLVCSSLLVTLVMALGCGGKRAAKVEANRGPATGTVTLEGKPLKGGSITFISVKDATYHMTCMIKPDGSFTVGNAPLGEVQVAVETESAKMIGPDAYVPIPRKYSKAKTSGLKTTIGQAGPDGENQPLTFDLKSK
jgi:hypothetical protein